MLNHRYCVAVYLHNLDHPKCTSFSVGLKLSNKKPDGNWKPFKCMLSQRTQWTSNLSAYLIVPQSMDKVSFIVIHRKSAVETTLPTVIAGLNEN